MNKEKLLAELREELVSTAIPEKQMSARSIIFSLMPEIIARRETGMTLNDLVEWFAAHDVKTTRSTLCNYIKDYQRQQEVMAPGQRPVRSVAVPAKVGGVAAKDFKNPFRKDRESQSAVDESAPGFVKLHQDL